MTHRRLPHTEFVILIAMLVATVAFSIDSMLPALPEIAAELTPDAPNAAQGVVVSFFIGLGVGTLFAGPLSDAIGRRAVMLWGSALYGAAALIAWRANSLEALFAARFLQGIGGAGPRVAAIAMVRDLYSGRQMARLVSYVMFVFTIVPALAPAIGAIIIAYAGWRGIFLAFVVFASLTSLWLVLRQAETRADEHYAPFSPLKLGRAYVDVLSNRQVLLSTAVQTLIYGMLVSILITTQPMFEQSFDRAAEFPAYFFLISILSAGGAFLNAQLVERIGMRKVVRWVCVVQIGISACMLAVVLLMPLDSPLTFAFTVFWITSVFFQVGMTLGNLNAIALEPMGHIAGLTTSVMTATGTVLGGVLAIAVGSMFSGTPATVAAGLLLFTILARLLAGAIPEEIRE